MADFPISFDGAPVAAALHVDSTMQPALLPANMWTAGLGLPVPMPVSVFKMRGQDAAIDSAYDAWLVTGEPDYLAAFYTGTLAKPLRDVVVIDQWEG